MNRSDAKHKRMQVMLENSATYSDVEFQVGPDGESFFGLKAIYARASEVFSKMFFEAGFREQHETSPRVVVKVEDIMPKSFQQLHRWVYDMDVTLTWDTVFGILDAARKYMVEDLELQCRRWVASEARAAAGAVGLFSAAAAGQWFQWSQALRSRVESFGAAALAECPEAVRQLPTDTFMELLTSEDLCVAKEEEVFEAVKAGTQCADECIPQDPAAVWQKIAESDVIHFPLLDIRSKASAYLSPKLWVAIRLDKRLKAFEMNVPGPWTVMSFHVLATTAESQNLFEEDPSPENLIGVWICPHDTLGLVRVLCKLNDSRKLAVLPLIKVLEALVRKAEESATPGGCTCDPVSAATELAAHLDKIRSRNGHLTALQNLRSLQQRLDAMSGTTRKEDWMLSPDREASASPRS
ncbi:BTBD3 [Symbiodinium pilosum]|uniref:BTBD3 protein n=1 Tax=Symbiodinium pilosum TaxID=2952 RepID=A0A812U6U1_SYMPI|nr:BTBD3 [Symbiodinium pilosum]